MSVVDYWVIFLTFYDFGISIIDTKLIIAYFMSFVYHIYGFAVTKLRT